MGRGSWDPRKRRRTGGSKKLTAIVLPRIAIASIVLLAMTRILVLDAGDAEKEAHHEGQTRTLLDSRSGSDA
jgi:hypothetical protein